MKRLHRKESLCALLLLIMSGTALPISAAVPPSITIRTSIVDNQGNGPNLPGSRAYRVRYFDAESGGNQLGAAVNGTTTIPSDGKLFLDVVPPVEILTAPAVFYDLAIDSDPVANGLDANDLFLGRIPVNSVPFALKAGSGGTLDDAYNAGGEGLGKTINTTLDGGSVQIQGPLGLSVENAIVAGTLNAIFGITTAGDIQAIGNISADAKLTSDHTAFAGAVNDQAQAIAFADGDADLVGFLAQDENGKHKVEILASNGIGGSINLLREDGVNGLEFNAQENNHPTIKGTRAGSAVDFEFFPRTDGNGSSALRFFNLANKEVVRAGNGNDAQGDGHGVVSVFSPSGVIAAALSGNANGNGGLLSLFNGAGNLEVIQLDAENGTVEVRGEVQTENASGTENVRLIGGDTDDGGLVRIMHGNGLETAQIYGGDNALGSQITLTNLGNKDTMGLTGGTATEGGEVVVGNAGGTGTGQLYGGDTGQGALLTLANQAGVARFEATGGNSSDGSVVSMTSSANKGTIEIRGGNATDGSSINLWNAAVANALQTVKLEGGDSALGGEFNFFNTSNGIASLTMKGGTTGGNASISLWNAAGTQARVNLDANTGNIDARGTITAVDAAGNRAAFMEAASGSVNVVHVLAYQSASSSTVTAGINGTTGEVFGTSKNFVVPDPSKEGRLIKYTSIEGPEAAIYFRGTADLVNGKATVTFPEHFATLVDPATVTVQLTPRSENSNGLASKNITATTFTAVELQKGIGSYQFDYLVQGVRKGYEDYKVYLDATDAAAQFGVAGQKSTALVSEPAPLVGVGAREPQSLSSVSERK